MTDSTYFYVAVKASLHAEHTSVFGLTPEEIIALRKRYPNPSEVLNGINIRGINNIYNK